MQKTGDRIQETEGGIDGISGIKNGDREFRGPDRKYPGLALTCLTKRPN